MRQPTSLNGPFPTNSRVASVWAPSLFSEHLAALASLLLSTNAVHRDQLAIWITDHAVAERHRRLWPESGPLLSFLINYWTIHTVPFIRLWARIAGHIHRRSILLNCTLPIVYLTCQLQIRRPQNEKSWQNDEMQRGLVTVKRSSENPINKHSKFCNSFEVITEETDWSWKNQGI